MPLLDHFHPPLSRTHPWRAFHGAWAAAMARLLNGGVLPAGYYAVPFMDRDGPVEIDIATLWNPPATSAVDDVQPWMPAAPGSTVAVEWPDLDGVRLEIHTDDGDPQLAAAVELVSPRNKDRPTAREAFAAKCAEYLRRGCGLVVVDAVTTRRSDPRADLMGALGVASTEPPMTLSAISYRSVGRNGDGRLQSWPSPLELGRPLPNVPLWIGPELPVPLDLEASYSAACLDLRIVTA